MSDAVSHAKAALLRTLDELEEAEGTLGKPPTRVDLCVVCSIGAAEEDGSYAEVGGWASTGGPQWIQAALLRRAADELDDSARDPDDE